jgi:hypothetical protein
MGRLRHRPSTLLGWPAGEAHHRACWPDATVERARALHAAGTGNAAIARALGVPRSTACGWTSRRRRTAQVVRVIATTRPTKGGAR